MSVTQKHMVKKKYTMNDMIGQEVMAKLITFTIV